MSLIPLAGNRTLRIALIGGATLLAIFLYGTDDATDAAPMNASDPYAADAYFPDDARSGDARPGERPETVRASGGQGQRVTLVDRGLQMPRGTQVVPEGWRLTQDLATDPNTGRSVRSVLDLRGPRGEVIRALGLAQYAQMMGTGFQQSWRQLAMQRLQGELSEISFGDLRRSEAVERSRTFQRVAQRVGQGMRMEALEAPLRARRDGQPVEGVVYLVHFAIDQYQAGTLQASVVLSPPGLLAETVRTNLEIQESHEPNPAFEQRLDQINQRVMQQQQAESQQRMAQSQRLHQQRMASNQAAFDAHQQRMQTLSGIGDMQMDSWQAQQRSSDEMHRRTINGINETVDLYDAQSGQTTYGVQSGYDSYWTDPAGNVVGAQGYDNPDPLRYNQATDLDDVYRQGGAGWGGYDGPDGW